MIPGFKLTDLLESLASQLCPACGYAKAAKQSFCRACYASLPMRVAHKLYARVGNGYEPAFAEAMAFLKATVVRLPARPRPTPAVAARSLTSGSVDAGDDVSNPLAVVVPFGKYCGDTVGDILRADPTYLPWLREKAESPRLARALELVCDEHDDEITAAIDERRRARRKW